MSEVNVADAGLDVDTEAPPPKKGGRLVKGVILVAAVIAIEVEGILLAHRGRDI